MGDSRAGNNNKILTLEIWKDQCHGPCHGPRRCQVPKRIKSAVPRGTAVLMRSHEKRVNVKKRADIKSAHVESLSPVKGRQNVRNSEALLTERLTSGMMMECCNLLVPILFIELGERMGGT